MINIDKLIIAFKLRSEGFNGVSYQFDTLQKEIDKIDNLNNYPTDDLIEFLSREIIPYKFGKTELRRADLKEIKTHFKNNYWVFVYNKKIGLLQWETYGNGCNFGHLTIYNESLYNGDWILYKQAINDLKLTISHISKLDIAHDSETNPTNRYLEIIKDKENEIIINGRKITNRNELLKTPYFLVYGTLDNPYKCPQINFTTKDKSTTINCYNKTLEIDTHSHKNYIKQRFLNKDKDIYRCEVSLNTHALNRLIDGIIECNNLDLYEDGVTLLLKRIEDNNYLKILHKESSLRLFRYSHKNTKRKTILSYYNKT